MKTSLDRNFKQILFLVLLIGVAPLSRAFDAEQLSAFTERGMDLWHVPGMSVAVVTRDDILFQKGFGKTAAENGQAVDEHTLFAIASTTKAMVVAGILILADEEKLSLDDPVITGRYRNSSFGDILINGSGSDMTLKTTLVDFEMSHWHLDTYLVEFETWDMHEFATFNIGPDGSITSVDVIGHTFERVPAE